MVEGTRAQRIALGAGLLTTAPERATLQRRGTFIAEGLLALRPAAFVSAARRQPASFWALAVYFFFEYVRPQSTYEQLDVLPFAQISLLAAIGFALGESNGARRWTLIDTGLIAYSAIVALSIPFAFDPQFGLQNSDLYVSWVLVFLLMTAILNSQTRLVIFLLLWFLWNLKMTQHAMREWAGIGFGFRDWGVGGAPGWFQNSGEFGIQMCVIVPISLYFALGVRKKVKLPVFLALLVLPVTGLMGAIASSSRGAVLGLAGVGLWMMARSKHRVRAFVGLAFAGALVVALMPEEQKERFSNSGTDDTSVLRLTYWKRGLAMANEYPVLGVGHENWLPYYLSTYGRSLQRGERVQLPHNIFVEALAELGYSGLFALFFLMGGTATLNARTRKLAGRLGPDGQLAMHLARGFDGALIGYAISGFFVTVLYYPYFWINLGFTVALHLSTARALRAGTARPAAGFVVPEVRAAQVATAMRLRLAKE